MNHHSSISCDQVRYELRFSHLFKAGRGYSFPCDVNGSVDLNSLSEPNRTNYFYARGLVGRELSAPFTNVIHGESD